MLAVIKTGGKQYKVQVGDKIKVEKVEGEAGKEVIFGEVLLVANEEKEIKIGKPHIKDAQVKGKILGQKRTKKVIVFKYKPKKRYHKKQGHRQMFSEVEITGIELLNKKKE